MDKGASLTTQCLAFCQVLASQGQAFSLAITVGSTFSFSLDNREKTTFNKVTMKKKPSPSTVKRNQKRREEFLTGNYENAESADLETSRQLIKQFKCDQCEQTVTTKKALKVHIGKTHKIVELSQKAPCPRDGSSDPPPGVPVDEFGLPLMTNPEKPEAADCKDCTSHGRKCSIHCEHCAHCDHCDC